MSVASQLSLEKKAMVATPTPHGRVRRSRASAVPTLLLVVILLSSPLVMASNVTGPQVETISGIVHDEAGVPKEGVLVRIEGTSLGTPSDSEGRFLLTGSDLDGAGTLLLSAHGYLTARVPYDLKDGGSWEASIYLVEEEAMPGTIEGIVRSFDDTPLPDAIVTLSGQDAPDRTVLTSEDGAFKFTEVPPEEAPYSVTAEAAGYKTVTRNVTVSAGAVETLQIAMVPELPTELVRGRVVDVQGRPLPGASVTIEGSPATWTTDLEGTFSAMLEGRMGHRTIATSLRGYTAASVLLEIPEPGVAWVDVVLTIDGRGGPETIWVVVNDSRTGGPLEDAQVLLEGLEGSWTTDDAGLAMVMAQHLEGTVTVSARKEGHTSDSRLVVLEDGGLVVVRLSLVRASPSVYLVGSVSDGATSEPIAGASVKVDARGIEWLTITGADGGFKVINLPPGVPTIVSVRAEGYRTLEVQTTLAEFAQNRLELELDPILRSEVEVRGRVVSALRGEPVAGAKVTLWQGGTTVLVWTDEDGTFVAGPFPAEGGDLGYVLDHREYVAISGELVIDGAQDPVPLNVVMQRLSTPKAVLRGTVADVDDLPVDGASVFLSLGQHRWGTLTVDGAFELYIAIEGDFNAEASASAPGYGWHNQTVIVRAKGVNWANFSLPLGPNHSNVLGTVLAEGRRPLEGAEVFLTRGGEFHRRTLTDASGSFAFRLVPVREEAYTLAVVIRGYSGASLEVRAEPGRTSTYVVTVYEDVTSVETVRGVVVNAEGTPLASAVVAVTGAEPVLSGPDGSFVIVSEGLEGSRYVSASSLGFETARVRVDIPPAGTVVVNVTLRVMNSDVTTVSGRVLKAANGRPLEGATVRLGWSGADVWTFVAPVGADGSFAFHGVPLAWTNVRVEASAEGFSPDIAFAILSETEVNWVEFYLRSERIEQPEEPIMTEEQAKQVGTGVGVTVVALTALLMTEVGRVALLGLLLVPLYTKIKREKVMDHFIRGRIYEFICQNPGVNYSAIKTQFKLTNGTVTYHLSMLERQEFVYSKQDGIYKRYFANGKGLAHDVEPMSVQLSVAKAIRERPGMTQKEIAKVLGVSKQLVSYHIRNMREEGLLDTKRVGRSVRVFPNPQTPE